MNNKLLNDAVEAFLTGGIDAADQLSGDLYEARIAFRDSRDDDSPLAHLGALIAVLAAKDAFKGEMARLAADLRAAKDEALAA